MLTLSLYFPVNLSSASNNLYSPSILLLHSVKSSANKRSTTETIPILSYVPLHFLLTRSPSLPKSSSINLSTLSINNVNNIGDAGHPCFTPSLMGISTADKPSYPLTLALTSLYISLIYPIISYGTPSSYSNVSHNTCLLTLSYAFSKSTKQTHNYSPLPLTHSVSPFKITALSSTLYPLRNPAYPTALHSCSSTTFSNLPSITYA